MSVAALIPIPTPLKQPRL